MARIIYQNEDIKAELAEEIDFGQAMRILKGYMDTDDILDALIGFEKRYEQEQMDTYRDEYENDFWQQEYRYEIFAYNLLVEGFGKMFAPKEVA